MNTDVPKYPHCDPRVLHSPGRCEFCDMYPEHQRARVVARVNFTGEKVPGFRACPSEMRRTLENIERWPGNRPSPSRTSR
jgi:hypothetical protein